MVEEKHAGGQNLRVAIQESLTRAHAINEAAQLLEITTEDSKAAKQAVG